jgi:putative transposase
MLMDFQPKNINASTLKTYLPFSGEDYFRLVDWTGRQLGEDKSGYIPADVASLIQEAGLNPTNWLRTVEKSSIQDQSIFGPLSKMKAWAQSISKAWLKGQTITLWKYLPS